MAGLIVRTVVRPVTAALKGAGRLVARHTVAAPSRIYRVPVTPCTLADRWPQ